MGPRQSATARRCCRHFIWFRVRTSVTVPSQSRGFVHARSAAGVRFLSSVLSGPPCDHCRLRLRSTRVHASVRGQRDGCQHDAGSVPSRCAHLIGVLDTIGISPEHGITGTASRGDLEGPRSGGQPAGTCIFSRHEAPECRSGNRCHPSTCGARPQRCAGPAQPSRAWPHDGAQVSLPRFGASLSSRDAS